MSQSVSVIMIYSFDCDDGGAVLWKQVTLPALPAIGTVISFFTTDNGPVFSTINELTWYEDLPDRYVARLVRASLGGATTRETIGLMTQCGWTDTTVKQWYR